MILRDQVIRLRAAASPNDGYGNSKADWNSASSITYPAAVQPMTLRSSNENVVDQSRTVTRWQMFLPPSADVIATDRIEWNGQIFEVDGDIEVWKRRGRPHHIEAVLVKVTQR